MNTSFSTTELARIQGIWQRMAEDFAPFNVDVTTEDPGVEALRKSTSTDTAYGVRVCIGGSSYTWLGAGAGGVAYIGSFNWNSDTPCFVFTEQLGTGNEKYTAEAASHEVGHTLGLNHDGKTDGTEYYAGHNNWAPIMGVGYYSEVTQWSKGEYSLANNLQDDWSVMQNYGATIMADDAGNTIASATTLSGSSFSVPGLIHRASDVDMFKFVSNAGTVTFSAATAAPSPNLDVLMSLYDINGTLVSSSNPTGLPGSLSATIPAGTYYLGIDGTGTGSATTGYSDYGSLGQYQLTGTVPLSTNQPPVAAATASVTSGTTPLAVTFSSNGSYDPDGSLATYNWNFGDGTSASNVAAPSHTYTTAGTFTATLTVIDNGGLTASSSVTISTTAPIKKVYVASINLSLVSSRKNKSATAAVTVKDANGAIVPGVSVRGSWTGVYSASQTATTNSTGTASFATGNLRRSGLLTFTVTGISGSGISYDSALNLETADVITIP